MRVVALLSLAIGLIACGSSGSLGFKDQFDLSNNQTALSQSDETANPNEDVVETAKLRVLSTAVSSGYIRLNDVDLLRQNDFKNTSFEQIMDIDLKELNDIEVEIRGSPGDQLCVEVFREIETDEGLEEQVIYERCVDRETGAPQNVQAVIDLSSK